MSFCFKAYKNADELYKKGTHTLTSLERPVGVIDAEDDFEQRAVIDMTTVSGVTFGDVEKDFARQGEVSVLQNKAQLRAQNLMRSDAGSQLLNDVRPSIITPGH